MAILYSPPTPLIGRGVTSNLRGAGLITRAATAELLRQSDRFGMFEKVRNVVSRICLPPTHRKTVSISHQRFSRVPTR